MTSVALSPSRSIRAEAAANIRIYTLSETAELLSVSVRTVQRAIDRRELKTIEIGRSVRISEAAISAFLDARIVE